MNNKKQTGFFAGNVIYLGILLCLVLLYLGVVYPKFVTKITELDTAYETERTKINAIAPYENDIVSLKEKIANSKALFEENSDLILPVYFSDVLYISADSSNVSIKSLSIEDTGAFDLVQGYIANLSTATLSVTAKNETQIHDFLNLIEQNSSAGFYVTSVSYSKGESQESNGELLVSIVLNMYTVPKS